MRKILGKIKAIVNRCLALCVAFRGTRVCCPKEPGRKGKKK